MSRQGEGGDKEKGDRETGRKIERKRQGEEETRRIDRETRRQEVVTEKQSR